MEELLKLESMDAGNERELLMGLRDETVLVGQSLHSFTFKNFDIKSKSEEILAGLRLY